MARKSKSGTKRPNGAPSTDHNAAVVIGVRRLDRGLRLAARRVERETGLSAAQLFVLEHLDASHATSLNELAQRTLTDRSSVSVVLDRLEKADLIRRVTAADDRRRQEIRITAAGSRVLKRAPLPPTDLLMTALERLPRASVARLGRTLAALNDALGFEDAPMLFEQER